MVRPLFLFPAKAKNGIIQSGIAMKTTPNYYENPRNDITGLIPEDAVCILDVGCGTGNLGAAIKRARDSHIEVVGIEINQEAAEKARGKLDKVITGNVETLSLPFPRGYFDVLVYGDVLEHMVDPWGILKRHGELLKAEGLVIASIPNVAHYRVIKMLKKKEWRYQDAGILDSTHIRFFTIKSIKRMFDDAGFRIECVSHNICGSKVKKKINQIFKNCLIDSLAEQYIITARKI